MGVFCDRLKFGSTAALNCRTGQNKGRYCKKELLLLLVSLLKTMKCLNLTNLSYFVTRYLFYIMINHVNEKSYQSGLGYQSVL